MDKKKFALQAALECADEKNIIRQGSRTGAPFWNLEASQFMYVPAFRFNGVPGCKRYKYTAEDEQGKTYAFEADNPYAPLTPIWKDLPEGKTVLTVDAMNEEGEILGKAGARTFMRLAPFSENLPGKKRTYREAVMKAFDYAMNHGFIKSWLTNGVPDPYYDLNIYPSKMISSLILAMLSYARICPEKKETALKAATTSADWLMSITPGDDAPLANLPLTYYLDFCPDPKEYGILTPNWDAAVAHNGTIMMIYPAHVGYAYLELEEATGNKKYLEAAEKIAEYYRKHVEPNGSWILVRSCATGEPVTGNYVSPLERVVPFLMKLYERTGEEKWKTLSDGAVKYVLNNQLVTYNWEGQFEDSPLSSNYANLTHYGPIALIEYFAKYDKTEENMKIADELMRFVEDQFVVWKRPAPWNSCGYDTSIWHTPAGLEQYGWHMPIDASTATIVRAFVTMYEAGRGEIHLAKALALADQLTAVQHDDGKIPTHWMNTEWAENNFWLNCMFEAMEELANTEKYENM